jgi:hypothetical protein
LALRRYPSCLRVFIRISPEEYKVLASLPCMAAVAVCCE